MAKDRRASRRATSGRTALMYPRRLPGTSSSKRKNARARSLHPAGLSSRVSTARLSLWRLSVCPAAVYRSGMIPRVANVRGQWTVRVLPVTTASKFHPRSARPGRPPLSRRLLRLLKLPILTPHNDRDDGRHRRARTGLRGFGLTGCPGETERRRPRRAPRLSLRAGDPAGVRRTGDGSAMVGDGGSVFGWCVARPASGGPARTRLFEIHDTTTLETGEYLLRERRARHERSPPIRRESDDPISHDADGATVQ
jgi:hypothetical protein